MTEIIPATTALLAEFYGEAPKRSQRAFVAVVDGRPLGVFGLYYDDGRMIAFSDMKPEARSLKKQIVRCAWHLASLIKILGVPVYALADCEAKGAARLLERLGFVNAEGDIYLWQQ